MPLSALAVRRITIDTKRALELTDSGLFWIPDEADLTHGWAIVCGPEDTPYYGGSFCFEVRFPNDYPFSPPAFTYLTNDGRTRFNPNLYKNGKVCLSLLNTWQGEQWSGVQSLSSILHSIQTAVLIPEPLRNEPAYSELTLHADIPSYTRMIQQATVETAILGQLSDPPPFLVPIYDVLRTYALKARPKIIEKLLAMAPEWDGKVETNSFYAQSMRYRFADLAARLEAIA